MPALSPEQLTQVRSKLISDEKLNIQNVVSALRQTVPNMSQLELMSSADQILADTFGLGLLEPLLTKPNVTDVLVNSFDEVWIDCGNGLERISVSWNSEDELREFAARLAAMVNRRLDDASPFVDAQLPNGIRFHAIIPPLSKSGTVMSFRVPNRKSLELKDLVALNTFDPNIEVLLKQLIKFRISFAISGNTGSGKTTFLGALLSEVPENERVIIVEDSAELRIAHPHVVSLQARNPNAEGIGGVELKQLVKQALRMRPDRLVIGEVRGTEVIDLLIALNTGHEGGCVTIHANSTEAVLARFEALGLLAKVPKSAIHSLLKQAIKVLLHIERTKEGRKLTQISLIDENPDGSLRILKVLDLINNQKFQPGWQKFQKLVGL